MLRFLRTVIPIIVIAAFARFAVFYMVQSHAISIHIADQVSQELTSNLTLEKVRNQGKLLSPAELAAIPGLTAAIEKDFGYLDMQNTGFYLIPAASCTRLPTLLGFTLPDCRKQLVIHVPSGVAYCAWQPEAMSARQNDIYNNKITWQAQSGPAPLSNPLIGWAPWATGLPYKDIKPRLAFALINWRDIEPQKGHFAFDTFEQTIHLDVCRKQGIRLIIRVVLDYPGAVGSSQLPDWLWREMKGDGIWYKNASDQKGFSPDYTNELLIAAHQRLITALGQRYDHDPAVAFIQLGSVGHYGEWYISSQAGGMPDSATLEKYVQPYRVSFPDKIFMFRRPVTQMSGLPAGLYNDMIGDEGQTERWLNWIATGQDDSLSRMQAAPDFWKYGPSGGEFAYGDPYRYLTDLNMPETLRQIHASHTSIIGPAAPVRQVSSEISRNADSILQQIGYHFRILSVSYPRLIKAGSVVTLQQSWENFGNSPMYYAWPVQLQLINRSGQVSVSWLAETDIRTWLPGPISFQTTFSLPATLSPGVYTWTVAILDPDTHKPGITLANAGERQDGTYEIGQIVVSAAGEKVLK